MIEKMLFLCPYVWNVWIGGIYEREVEDSKSSKIVGCLRCDSFAEALDSLCVSIVYIHRAGKDTSAIVISLCQSDSRYSASRFEPLRLVFFPDMTHLSVDRLHRSAQ